MNLIILHIIAFLAITTLVAYFLWKYFDRRYKSVAADLTKEKKERVLASYDFQQVVNMRTITELLHAMPVGVKVYDSSGTLISSNLRDREIFGVPDAVDLAKFTIFTSPVLPKTLVSSFKAQLPFKDTITYDFSELDSSYQSKFKHIKKTLTISGYPIIDIKGQGLEKYVVTTEDVTDTAKLKQNLKDIAHDLKTVADAAGVSVWGYDVKNDSAYEVRGDVFGLEYLDLRGLLQRIHCDDRNHFAELMRDLCDGKKESANIVCRFMDLNKRAYIWAKYILEATKGADGSVVKVIGLFTDITSTVKLEDDINRLYGVIAQKDGRISDLIYNLDIALGSTHSNLFKFDFKTGEFSYIFSTGVYKSSLTLQEIYSRTDAETAAMLKRYFVMIRDGELKTAQFTYPHTIANKAMKYLRIDLRVICNDEGKPDYIIGTQHDTTAEHAMKKHMQLNVLRTRMVLEASGEEYWEYDAMHKIFKKMPSENTVERVEMFDDFVNSVNAQDLTKEFLNAMTAVKCRVNTPQHIEVRMKYRHDERWQNVVITIIPVELDDRGFVLTYACVKRNITEAVSMRNEIIKKNAETELALGAGHITPFNIDVNEAAVLLPINNSIVNSLFGSYTPTMPLDGFIKNITKKKGGNALRNDIARLISGEATQVKREVSTTDFQKATVYLELSLTATNYDRNGVPSAIVGLVQDITEHRHLLASLNNARKQAEESNRLKSAFLANMSHEIRTPLNAIVGFSQLLIEADDVDERREYSSLIETNNDLLLHLIGDILDLSKIEAGMMVLRPQQFDLAEIFAQSGKSMQQKCMNMNPGVVLKVDNPYKSCVVTLDPNRLTQVWTNFATNSIKYTKDGSITMGYKYENGNLHIYVQDTGIGISDEKQSLVFKRFRKLDDFAQGTGLGLSIVKAIVEQCGGTVDFISEVGKGSTFFADIPCDAVIELND